MPGALYGLYKLAIETYNSNQPFGSVCLPACLPLSLSLSPCVCVCDKQYLGAGVIKGSRLYEWCMRIELDFSHADAKIAFEQLVNPQHQWRTKMKFAVRLFFGEQKGIQDSTASHFLPFLYLLLKLVMVVNQTNQTYVETISLVSQKNGKKVSMESQILPPSP